jgi:type II secretion system protein N
VHARVSLPPLLIGRVSIGFGAKAFGGSIEGTTRTSDGGRIIEASLEGVDLGKLDALGDLFGGAPMVGTLRGQLEWTLPEAKLSKANGTFSLAAADLSVGDGKTKLAGKLVLPRLDVGALDIAADIKSGVARIEKFAAQGQDLDLSGEGKITLRDAFSDSIADIFLRFRFSDGYRNKSDMTKSLFGSPGSSVPPLFELDPRVKIAKRPDGFYGWRMVGELKEPRFDAAPSGAPPGALPARTPPRAPN